MGQIVYTIHIFYQIIDMSSNDLSIKLSKLILHMKWIFIFLTMWFLSPTNMISPFLCVHLLSRVNIRIQNRAYMLTIYLLWVQFDDENFW